MLNGVIAETDAAHARERDRRVLAARAYDPAVLADKLARPLARAVTEPEPEPVVPCHLDDLAPLFAHLSDDAPVERQTAFARGTLTPDGRLDLCKQVVGPEGIRPLLGAMQFTSRVKRLLLGNVYERLGNRADALNEYRAATRIDRRNTQYMHRLVDLLVATNDRAGAIATLRQILAIAPNDRAAQGRLTALGAQ